MPTQEEMERKASGGPQLLRDLERIKFEFPSHETYAANAELEHVVPRCKEAVQLLGYTLSDASHLFDGINDGLLLIEKWSTLVHTVRTSKQMLFLRRTPENSAAMLVIQRLEHLRGMVSELSPLAFAVVVRDDQMLVTRDQVADFDTVKEQILHMARTEELCPICGVFLRARVCTVFKCAHTVHSDCFAEYLNTSNVCPTCRAPVGEIKPVELDITEELEKFRDRRTDKPHNMLPSLFSQEMMLVRSLRKATIGEDKISSEQPAADVEAEEREAVVPEGGEGTAAGESAEECGEEGASEC